ncbi:maleylpyruvate isomerase family mycothiol-dependent enzyme [Saccharothrix sp. S26]|uniref:maleylpyruvate isomerase family mycothiol-dependent enzyme n=1 Tax=Saccharothrix sp. S26 TaxID=2907215 RepID=UPI001F1877E2|nr:maleylpyruvate isomerase family mycothiol-dependent enzyme [Saccharothrix sp. S26]MCE6994191.1 maleylpyruvate isomerase family mycothiol-dependent enzyme [Saccharothrix sp. S26]
MGINHLAVVESYSASFTEAVAGNLGAPVPSCPGWTVDDLVAHLARVQAWWTVAVLARGAYPDEEAARRAADTGPDRVEGWREVSARYVAVQEDYLRGAGPDAPVWVWWNDEERDTASALVARQAHEAVVHCWDARRAAGALEPIPAELAADGVDDFLARFLRGERWTSGPAVLELAATDTGQTWLLGTDGTAKPRRLAEGRADARLTGTAEQLYLLLWRRLGVGEVTVTGDGAAADALLGWPDLT